MKAEETVFQKLVQGQRQFQIPLYQRTYSWREAELRRLWADILEQASMLQAGTPGSTHFLGSVVLAPSPVTEPPGVERLIVVDGQQRLTTLMLALCALRDHSVTEAPRTRDRLNELYLTNKFNEGLDYYRLLPTQADRPSFVACVEEQPDAGGGDNIGAAYRFFRKALAEADDPEDPYDIARIEAVLLQRLAIVEIRTDPEDDIYRIFESLNNTGRRLTQADLLRNYLFMCLPTRGEEVYADLWLPMQERLGDHLEHLFFLDLVLRGNERAKRTDVYGAQRARLEPLKQDEAAIVREIAELERRSRHLRRIIEPADEPHPGIRAAFERLNTWGAQTTHPLLLHLLDIQDRGGAVDADVEETLAYVESFLVRRMLANIPTNNLNRIFHTIVARGLREDLPIADAVRHELSATRRYWPSDQEIHEAVRSKPFAWTGRQDQRSLVLRRLEEQLAGATITEEARLTVKYVMPERLSEAWAEVLVDEAVEEEVSADDVHASVAHTLGNLTLGDSGAQLSVHPDDRRQQLFEKADLALNREVAGVPSWGATAIRYRAHRLADLAIEIWPAPLGDGNRGSVEQRDWSLLHQALAALPSGSWTTYGDLATLIGSHPVPVGVHLSKVAGIANAHRVLGQDGKVRTSFRWSDPKDSRDVHEVLRAEGVSINDQFAADPAQRMTAEDLADLVGLNSDLESQTETDLVASPDGQSEQFWRQLGELRPTSVADGVRFLLGFWQGVDGAYLDFRGVQAATCSLMFGGPAFDLPRYRPFTLYSAGSIVIPFTHLRQAPPFDDGALCEAFRRRCNEAAGVRIPEAKLQLRPRFELAVLADADARDRLIEALNWFVQTVRMWGRTSG